MPTRSLEISKTPRNDCVFVQLKVWVDRNSDGSSDGCELLTLQEAGVASINLAHAPLKVVFHKNTLGNIFTLPLDSAIHA
jgi:hypothetical protein